MDLFKYGKIDEHSEAAFSTPVIFFQAPNNLNDPFECRPWFTFNGTKEQIMSFLIDMTKKSNPGIDDDPAKEHARSIYTAGRHDDPKELAKLRQAVIRMLRSEIGRSTVASGVKSHSGGRRVFQ